MQAGFFDEYRLCVAPIILGKGRQLFDNGLPTQVLNLLEARTLATGGVLVRYEVER